MIKIKTVLDQLPGYVYWKNFQFQYEGCNVAFLKLLNISHEDLIGKTDLELNVDIYLRRILEGDNEITLENPYKIEVCEVVLFGHEKTHYFNIERKAIVENGELEGVITTLTNITNQKRDVEKATMQLQEDIVANMPGYIYWKNKNSEYLGCNNNLAEISGLSHRSEIIGKTDLDFVWGKYEADKFVEDDQEVMNLRLTKTTEHKMARKDGGHFYVRTEKMPLYDRKGEVIGILGIAIDITDKAVQERKIQREKEIAKREYQQTSLDKVFLEDIIYNLPGLIYWKNKNSQYIGFNKNVVKLSGLTREELFGKTDNELNWGRKEGSSFRKDDLEVMENGKVKSTEHTIPIKRSDGKDMVVRTDKSVLKDHNGDVVGVLGVAVDVTEEKILRENLKKEKAEVEKANQMKIQFIHNMEHDIRTPFTGIFGLAECLYRLEDDKNKKEYLGDIVSCAKELLNYCNSIIDYSKINMGSLTILSKKFLLKELINRIVNIETPSAKHKGLLFTANYDKNLPDVIIGDSYRLYRILLNLLGNAIKFTEKGNIKLTARVIKKIDRRNIIIRFSVEDTGMGIPEDKINYIYDKFNKLIPSNKGTHRGVGLGLGIVKQFCEEMEGEIDIVSMREKGTKFYCTFPFKLPLTNDFTEKGENYD